MNDQHFTTALCVYVRLGTGNLTVNKDYSIIRQIIRCNKQSFVIRDDKGKLRTYYNNNYKFKLTMKTQNKKDQKNNLMSDNNIAIEEQSPFIVMLNNKYPQVDISTALSILDKTVKSITPSIPKVLLDSDLNKDLFINILSQYLKAIQNEKAK